MPFDANTANIGLRWWACQALQDFTGDGEGVEWVKNEPYGYCYLFIYRFDNLDGQMGISEITGVEIPHQKGMYTRKMCNVYNVINMQLPFV